MIRCFCLGIAVLFSAGCESQRPTVADTANTPESVYRELMIAMVSGDEKAVRNLIVETDGAEVLWEGEYPKDVASLLIEQYRTMEIARSEMDGAARVVLNSSAFPLPLAVIKTDDSWKVDAAPIIEARHRADSVRTSQ